MIKIEKWYEKAEDKLVKEYEETKSPTDWNEFVLNKYEEFTSEIEDYEYESYKIGDYE